MDSTVVLENFDMNLEKVLQSYFETFKYQKFSCHQKLFFWLRKACVAPLTFLKIKDSLGLNELENI